jgi:hypothetical protein
MEETTTMSINRNLSITLLSIIVLLNLTIVGTVCAKVTKPSPPKFTIQIPNNSTIQLVIENQAFTNSSTVNSIVYYFRVKDHNSNLWLESGNYNLQSNSKTTIISIPPLPGMSLLDSILSSPLLNNSTLLDFQVQAETGYYEITNKSGSPPLVSPAPQNWHTEITFNPAETSDWSNTQTVIIPSTSGSLTPTPTQTNQLNASPIIFSSGLTITSPVNKTYTSNIVECSGTFDCPKDYQSSLNYSIDGIGKGALPWKLDANSIANPDIYTIDGSFELPQLSDGSHQLSIGILEQLYDNSNVNSLRLVNSSSWINTIYFTIGTQPTPTGTPAIEPFPATLVFVASVGIAVVAIGLVICFKKYHGRSN